MTTAQPSNRRSRSPAAYGWLTKRGDATTVRCLGPVLTRPEIRQDTVRV